VGGAIISSKEPSFLKPQITLSPKGKRPEKKKKRGGAASQISVGGLERFMRKGGGFKSMRWKRT